jgi:hypothetical protein
MLQKITIKQLLTTGDNLMVNVSIDFSSKENQQIYKVKGMTKMSDKQLQGFAYQCVVNYATYNKCDNFYSLAIYQLPDFIIHQFASMLMSSDKGWAMEAISPDNENWELMESALINHLKNSTDKDGEIEFNNIWRHCITNHMHKKMQEFLDEAIYEFNSEHRLTKSPEETYGVKAYGYR